MFTEPTLAPTPAALHALTGQVMQSMVTRWLEAAVGPRDHAIQHVDDRPQLLVCRLTERELEVIAEMAAGWSNTGIMQRLSLSSSSVEKHITSIFAKLDLDPRPDVHRRVAAVRTYLAAHRPDA